MGRDQEWPSLVGTKPAAVILRGDMQPAGFNEVWIIE